MSLILRGGPPTPGGGACSTITDTGVTATSFANIGTNAALIDSEGCNFTAGSSYTVCAIDIWLKKTLAPDWNLHVLIYNDNAGTPGNTVLATSSDVVPASISTTAAYVKFPGLSFAIVSGTKYWISVERSAGGVPANDSTNFYSVGYGAHTGFDVWNHSGGSWAGAADFIDSQLDFRNYK